MHQPDCVLVGFLHLGTVMNKRGHSYPPTMWLFLPVPAFFSWGGGSILYFVTIYCLACPLQWLWGKVLLSQ